MHSMMMKRRDLLLASGMSLLAGMRASGQGAALSRPQPEPQDTPQARLLEALKKNRLPLTMSDGPGGRGWDWLVKEARDARFTLIGEEHGVAETAQLAAALFGALRGSGYSRVAIELSPIIAQDVEAAARRNGLRGILAFFGEPDTWSPMYLREEAQFLATVVEAAPAGERVLWGLDREIFSDRHLISQLEPRVPRRARESFTRLKEASTNAWAQNQKNPGPPFLFSQDPALVSAVRAAWPNPDRESDTILRTLEESLAINTAARTGTAWDSSERRAQWMRNNLAARLREERGRGASPKVMMKFGYNHMIRGANYVNIFDLGAMTDEVAALDGGRAFHILVLPGPGSRQAVLGPGRSFVAVSSDEFDEFKAGDQRLTRVLSNANATGHEVIDFRPLRTLAMRGLESWNSDLVRTIHGYDAAVIWKSARASSS
jgi:erythromycin esterase-like protein